LFAKVYQGPKVREIPEGVRIERGIAPPEKSANYGKLVQGAVVPPSGGGGGGGQMIRGGGGGATGIGRAGEEIHNLNPLKL
jgi:hypothetical protein